MSLDLKSGKNNKFQEYFEKDQEEDLLESPHDMLIEEHAGDELMHWRGQEYEVYEKSNRWYLIATIGIAIISIYALINNSPVMAITFILIGIVGYLYLQKDPRILDFRITDDGMMAGKEIYEFDNIKSFWIFYDPPHEKILSLHMKHSIIPYIHIPIHNQDPVQIREILLEFIPEEKQEKTIIDVIERVFHI